MMMTMVRVRVRVMVLLFVLLNIGLCTHIDALKSFKDQPVQPVRSMRPLDHQRQFHHASRFQFRCQSSKLGDQREKVETIERIDRIDRLVPFDPDEPRETWQTIALSDPVETVETWDLNSRNLLTLTTSPAADLDVLNSLKGTYYINGLSTCAVGKRLVHPFEAHGFLKSLEFHGNGTVTYRSRFVNTPCTAIERTLKTPLFRGVMSAPFTGPLTLLNAIAPQERNTANLACRLWPPANSLKESQLLVGGDNGVQYVVDANSLTTQSPLPDVQGYSEMKDKKTLAHTRYDSTRQRMVMAACKFEIEKPGSDEHVLLQFWEYDDQGELVSQREYRTDLMVMHDWTITDNYYVVPKNPAKMKWGNLPQFLGGFKRGVEVFGMDTDKNGAVLLIPRHDPGAAVIEAPADTFFNIFHIGPTYEEPKPNPNLNPNPDPNPKSDPEPGATSSEETQVVFHGVVFDNYEFGNEMGFDVARQEFDPTGWSTSETAQPPRLDRFIICPKEGRIISRTRLSLTVNGASEGREGQVDVPVDMPTFHPLRDGKSCRYCYFTGGRQKGWFPFRKLIKADLQGGATESWEAGQGKIVSEPLIIPLPLTIGQASTGEGEEEDRGFVFSMVHNAKDQRLELAVLNAQKFSVGPCALLDLGTLAPWSVHGHWVPGV